MEEPKRVLHVLGRLDRGGAETLVMNLYRNIDRNKVQFDFVIHTTDKCDYNDEIKSLGGRIYSLPTYTGKNHLQYKKSWNRLFIDHPEYNIIHGHVRSTASIYLKVAKKNGLITIAHSHNTSSGIGFAAIVKYILQYKIRYTADFLFACSKNAGVWLFGKRACKKSNFYILNNAIDTEIFTFNEEIRLEKRNEFEISDKFVIGHVGRFHTQKNHGFIIDIFKEVYDENKNTVLMLVGDGDLRHLIEEKVNKLGLIDNIIITGVRSDIPELYQAMDLFLFPSLYEGLGMVAIEAQASGLPCIIANTIPEEVYITSLVETLSLKDSANLWAKHVLNYTNGYNRLNMELEIKNARYDIKEIGLRMEQFYIKYG